MKDLGKLKTFLGIKITNTSEGLFLSQESYHKKLLTKFNMSDCKSARTPMECNFVNNCQDDLSKDKPYRELVECLMYLTQTTRPDISFPVNFFSRFQSEPKENHWRGLKRILRYLQGTLNYGLIFYKSNERSREPLIGFADADWGSTEDRKSTSGFVYQLFGNTICWATRRQNTLNAKLRRSVKHKTISHVLRRSQPGDLF